MFETNLSAAVKKQKEINSAYIAFIRAMHLAQLETEGRYEAEKHDPYFEQFGATHISEDEWGAVPVVLYLANQNLPQHMEQLHDIIGSGLNIKIILPLDNLVEHNGDILQLTASAMLAQHMGSVIRQYTVASFRWPLLPGCKTRSWKGWTLTDRLCFRFMVLLPKTNR